jgi:hypothetical protein
MIRLLCSGMVVFAGIASVPLAVAPNGGAEPAADYREDPRFEKLRSFFQKTDCPAQHYASAFLEAADRYDLDWRLLPSLSYIESTGGKAARNNNFFGWGTAQFITPTAGIHEVGYRLAYSSLYRDKDLDTLLGTYNPLPEYAQKVKSVMKQIAPW